MSKRLLTPWNVPRACLTFSGSRPYVSATADAAKILDGETAMIKGVMVEGTMPNNGDQTKSIDGLTATSVTIPAGYTTGGTVSLTSDIEEALAAI